MIRCVTLRDRQSRQHVSNLSFACTSCGTIPVRPFPWAGSRLCLKRTCLINYLTSGLQICHKVPHLTRNGNPRVYLSALSSFPSYKGRTRDLAQLLSSRHSHAAPPSMPPGTETDTNRELISSQPKVRAFALSPRETDSITACLLFFLFKGYCSDESGRGKKCPKSPNRTGQ